MKLKNIFQMRWHLSRILNLNMQKECMFAWLRNIGQGIMIENRLLKWKSNTWNKQPKGKTDLFWLKISNILVHSPCLHWFWTHGEAEHHGSRSIWRKKLFTSEWTGNKECGPGIIFKAFPQWSTSSNWKEVSRTSQNSAISWEPCN